MSNHCPKCNIEVPAAFGVCFAFPNCMTELEKQLRNEIAQLQIKLDMAGPALKMAKYIVEFGRLCDEEKDRDVLELKEKITEIESKYPDLFIATKIVVKKQVCYQSGEEPQHGDLAVSPTRDAVGQMVHVSRITPETVIDGVSGAEFGISKLSLFSRAKVTNPVTPDNCGNCEACDPEQSFRTRMITCSTCGNKRCPKATDHHNKCTGSNEVGQKGSSWERVVPIDQKNKPIADEINTKNQEAVGQPNSNEWLKSAISLLKDAQHIKEIGFDRYIKQVSEFLQDYEDRDA